MSDEAIEGEIVNDETENVPERTGQSDAIQAFHGSDVDTGVQRAREIADRLRDIITEKQLSVSIPGGGEHLRVEAWITVGSLVGIMPATEWTREVRNPSSGELEGYEARVRAMRVTTGEEVAAAEAGCYYDEMMRGKPRWQERHAVQSMAQTRATSKALAQCLRWIPTLAGYSGTPLEEMPAEKMQEPQSSGGKSTPAQPRSKPSSGSQSGNGGGTEPAGAWTRTAIAEVEQKKTKKGSIMYRVKSASSGKWATCFDTALGDELERYAGTDDVLDIYVTVDKFGPKIEAGAVAGEDLAEINKARHAEPEPTTEGEPEPPQDQTGEAAETPTEDLPF